MKNMIIGLSVKATTALETGRNWAQSGKLTHRKAFVLGMAAAMISVAGDAFALAPTTPAVGGTSGGKDLTSANPLANVQKTVCTVTGALQGPIGIAIIVALVVIAGLSLATGGKNSTSLLISALIGGAVVFGAKALLALATGATTTSITC
jgi:type IV secretory pathway VirB2 component (pilin)